MKTDRKVLQEIVYDAENPDISEETEILENTDLELDSSDVSPLYKLESGQKLL